MQIVVLQGLGSSTREGMGVCKCIVPSRHGGALNSSRAASFLVSLVEGKERRRATSPLVLLGEGVERWEAPDHPQVSFLKIGVETSQIVPSPVWRSKQRLTTGVT
ncbi:hypothetical protein TNCV_4876701 [Trichonephila clavipes]|nr:hypothetical protein TNCV_4876701 [Trichonephila clavipes]